MGGPFHPHRHRRGGRNDPAQIPPEQLRFGVQFSDGRKATSVAVGHWGEGSPSEPVLMPNGGNGGLRSWDISYWLWPLPPPGPLEFVVEWPIANIPNSNRGRRIIDRRGRSKGGGALASKPGASRKSRVRRQQCANEPRSRMDWLRASDPRQIGPNRPKKIRKLRPTEAGACRSPLLSLPDAVSPTVR